MIYQNILETIGNTPLVKINKLNPNPKVLMAVKLEFLNPGGSIKDRIGSYLVAKAEKEGFIDEGQRLVFNNDFTGFIFRVKEAELHFRNLEAGEILFLKQYKLILTDVEKHPKVNKVRNLISEMNQQEQIIITKTIEVKKLILEIDVETKNESFLTYLDAIKKIHTFPAAPADLIEGGSTLKQSLDDLIPSLKKIGEKESGLISRTIKIQREVTESIGKIYHLLEKVRRKLS